MRIINKFSLLCLFSAFGSLSAHAASDGNADLHASNPWPLQEVFEQRPAAATPRPGSSCEVAGKYIRLIDSRQAEKVGELFAEDGVFLDPFGVLHKGRADVGKWFAEVAKVGGPTNANPLSFTDSGPECFMEIAGVLPNAGNGKYGLTAIDHFTVNEQGLIVRAVYYFRPPVIRALPKPDSH